MVMRRPWTSPQLREPLALEHHRKAHRTGRTDRDQPDAGVAPLQEAVAVGLETADDYYAELAAMYQANRDFLADALAEAGMLPNIPKGTYFMMADISPLGFADDVTFCRYLTTEVGVAAIPPSAFYHNPADGATKRVRVPQLAGLSLRDAAYRAHTAGLRVRLKGSGSVASTRPEAGSTLQRGDTLLLVAEGR